MKKKKRFWVSCCPVARHSETCLLPQAVDLIRRAWILFSFDVLLFGLFSQVEFDEFMVNVIILCSCSSVHVVWQAYSIYRTNLNLFTLQDSFVRTLAVQNSYWAHPPSSHAGFFSYWSFILAVQRQGCGSCLSRGFHAEVIHGFLFMRHLWWDMWGKTTDIPPPLRAASIITTDTCSFTVHSERPAD